MDMKLPKPSLIPSCSIAQLTERRYHERNGSVNGVKTKREEEMITTTVKKCKVQLNNDDTYNSMMTEKLINKILDSSPINAT